MKAGQRKRPKRPPHPGEEGRIAERRARVWHLHKKGYSIREIEQTTGVPRTTVHADILAEFSELREQTRATVEATRAIELERTDAMTRGLWPEVERGDPKSVMAAVRVSERRARLLGLDAPTESKTEISGTLGVSRERLKEALRRLPTPVLVEYDGLERQVEELRAKQDALLHAAGFDLG